MRTRLQWPALLVVATLAASCGSDGTSEADTTTTVDAVDPVAAALAGRYAHYDVVAYESPDMKTLIISYGFTDLAVEGGELMATESFCHAEHRSDQPITVTMSDAATSAIQPVPIAVTITTVDGRTRISRPETPTGIGIEFEDPANDPLPTDPDDPRIVDDDGDGNPGITTHIKVSDALEGDLYLARREIFAYEVDEQDDGSLIGTVSDHSEQLLLGASNELFMTAQAPWVQVADPTKSPIVLIPVEDTWDCERLMAESEAIFPPVPEVDW